MDHCAAPPWAFYEGLRPEGYHAEVECVTIDLSGAFFKAVEEGAPKARIIRLLSPAARERRSGSGATRATAASYAERPNAGSLTGLASPGENAPSNLTASDRGRLSAMQCTNASPCGASLLKEALAWAVEHRQAGPGLRELRLCLVWTTR
jgi:hypothetical protein